MSVSLKAEDVYIIPKYKVVIDNKTSFLQDSNFKMHNKSYKCLRTNSNIYFKQMCMKNLHKFDKIHLELW